MCQDMPIFFFGKLCHTKPELARHPRNRLKFEAQSLFLLTFLQDYLESSGVDTSKFGKGNAKPLAWLYQEMGLIEGSNLGIAAKLQETSGDL